MNIKYVVIIQCDIAHNRCSGFACTNAFYNKDAVFKIMMILLDIYLLPVVVVVERVLLQN